MRKIECPNEWKGMVLLWHFFIENSIFFMFDLRLGYFGKSIAVMLYLIKDMNYDIFEIEDEKQFLQDLAYKIYISKENPFQNEWLIWHKLIYKLDESMNKSYEKYIINLPENDEFYCKLYIKISSFIDSNKNEIEMRKKFKKSIFSDVSGFDFLMDFLLSQRLLIDDFKNDHSRKLLTQLINSITSIDFSDFSPREIDLLEGFIFEILFIHTKDIGVVGENDNLVLIWKEWLNNKRNIANGKINFEADAYKWFKFFLPKEQKCIHEKIFLALFCIIIHQEVGSTVEKNHLTGLNFRSKDERSFILEQLLRYGSSEKFLLKLLKPDDLSENKEYLFNYLINFNYSILDASTSKILFDSSFKNLMTYSNSDNGTEKSKQVITQWSQIHSKIIDTVSDQLFKLISY